MGSLSVPASGLVYLDANPIIYTVEKHPVYGPLLQPLWREAQAGTIEVVSSELAFMEVLVGPLKSGNAALERAYEQAFLGTEMRLLPITQAILREAAGLRNHQTENTRRAARGHGAAGGLRPFGHERCQVPWRGESPTGDPG